MDIYVLSPHNAQFASTGRGICVSKTTTLDNRRAGEWSNDR